MSESESKRPSGIKYANRNAKARGLPDGWTSPMTRRKSTAPDHGRSCDSLTSDALQISVDQESLPPPDTKNPTGKRKRTKDDRQTDRPLKVSLFAEMSDANEGEENKKEDKSVISSDLKHSKQQIPRRQPRKPSFFADVSDAEEESEEAEEEVVDNGPLKQPPPPPPPPLDPEHSLDGKNHPTAPTTVHWDPKSIDGKKIGWKIRLALDSNTWVDGRIVRYDPYTHKHKIRLHHNNQPHDVWIWIRNEQHSVQLATRMVWAHVKGYSWSPAMVIESTGRHDPSQPLQVEFFGTGKVSSLRDSPESIQPFLPHQMKNPLVVKHKQRYIYNLACQEFEMVRKTRNEAALFYAEKSLHLCNQKAPLPIVGRRVQIFRDDTNYPFGDTVFGKICKYSDFQKKFLVSFEVSGITQSHAAWMALTSSNAKLLGDPDAHAEVTPEALVPFLVGYQVDESDADDNYYKLLNDHCRGCVEVWKTTDTLRFVCDQCDASYHLGCFDPPLQHEQYQESIKDGVPVLCPQCTMCRGCYQKDTTFGSHQLSKIPRNLTFPTNETLNVCLPCREAYGEDRYCPNCAHTWNDVRFNEVRRQHAYYSSCEGRIRKSELVEDTEFPLVMGAFSGDDKIPHGLKVRPSLYYPETTEFGMAEAQMVECDSCRSWVHAGCANITVKDFEQILDGNHPLYGREFLCRICCRQRCHDIIQALKDEDQTDLFAQTVCERDAPDDHDLINRPMDLKTMMERAQGDECFSYAWTREMFELMVMNALTFNRLDPVVCNEAKRFYYACLEKVFQKIGKAAPPGPYDTAVQRLLNEVRCQEPDRARVDEAVAENDFVLGNTTAPIGLALLRTLLPDNTFTSCVPLQEEGRRGQPTDASSSAKELDAKEVEEDNRDKENCPPVLELSEVSALRKHLSKSPANSHRHDGKRTEHIPPHSPSPETSQSATESVSSARPRPPYKQNVVGRMVWFRPKRDEMFWIRGRVEKCERLLVDEVGGDGTVSTSESVFHVVRCSDDDTALFRVNLQQIDEPDNLIWM